MIIVMRMLLSGYADRVIEWVYLDTTDWSRIADLAPLALKAAQDGDDVAMRIIRRATSEHVNAVRTVIRRMKWQEQKVSVSSVTHTISCFFLFSV